MKPPFLSHNRSYCDVVVSLHQAIALGWLPLHVGKHTGSTYAANQYT